jgi:hypothetical protein
LIFIGFIQLIGNIISVIKSDVIGRRRMMLLVFPMIAACMFSLSFAMLYKCFFGYNKGKL